MWNPYYEIIFPNQSIVFPMSIQLPIIFPIVEMPLIIPREDTFFRKQNKLNSNNSLQFFHQDLTKTKYNEMDAPKDQKNIQDELLKNIKLILSNINIDNKKMEREIYQNHAILKIIGKQFFKRLILKFKKITKTKQEIIKYLMRKAFKFINDKLKNSQDNLQTDNFKQLIQKINEGNNNNISFKRNLNYKTMNSHYLTILFSSTQFTKLYEQFLENFPQIFEIDNNRKIENLVQDLLNYIEDNPSNLKKFNNLKRLPWPRHIMQECLLIGNQIQKYSNKSNSQSSSWQRT